MTAAPFWDGLTPVPNRPLHDDIEKWAPVLRRRQARSGPPARGFRKAYTELKLHYPRNNVPRDIVAPNVVGATIRRPDQALTGPEPGLCPRFVLRRLLSLPGGGDGG